MRIGRFSIILLILLVSPFFIVPNGIGKTPIEPRENSDHGNSLTLNAVNPGHPVGLDFNASIIFDARNITIKVSSRVVVEDAITLKIYDEKSSIAVFNYSIPTVFAKFVEKVTFFSQFDTPVGLQVSENVRPYTKYMGENITTYFVDIRENGLAANNTLDEGVAIFARVEAINLITFENFNEDQIARFISPIRPIYPNLRIDDSIIGVIIEAGQDEFIFKEINQVEVNSQFYPIIRGENRRLEWKNMTRDPLDLIEGLVPDYDYTTLTFKSKTVPSDKLSVTVPYEYTEAIRNVRVDPWGTVFVKETVSLLHTGAKRLENFTTINRDFQIGGVNFIVGSEALVTDVYDDLGSLDSNLRVEGTNFPRTTIDTESNKQIFQINFRNKLFGGETYTFTVEYQYDASKVIEVDKSRGIGQTFTLNTPLFSDFNTTVQHLQVNFELPPGSKLKENSYQSGSSKALVTMSTKVDRATLSFFRNIALKIDIENANSIDNKSFQIVFEYNGLGHYQYIITFLLVMMALLSLFVLFKQTNFTSSQAIETEKEKIPVDELDTFFNLFSERSGANLRKADLREKLRSKKMTKREYEGQRKAIQRRIREINPKLEIAAKKLSEKGTRYERLVDKVMIGSQKQEDIRSNMLRTRKSYRGGETTKDIYQKLMKGYTDELAKHETTINKTLAEILQLITEYT